MLQGSKFFSYGSLAKNITFRSTISFRSNTIKSEREREREGERDWKKGEERGREGEWSIFWVKQQFVSLTTFEFFIRFFCSHARKNSDILEVHFISQSFNQAFSWLYFILSIVR